MNVFGRALEILDAQGWTQNPVDTVGGAVCLGFALGDAKATFEDADVVRGVIAERYPDRVTSAGWLPDKSAMGGSVKRPGDVVSIPGFNDHPETTEEDVRLVLKLASGKEADSA